MSNVALLATENLLFIVCHWRWLCSRNVRMHGK